jgi:hypothetical protein
MENQTIEFQAKMYAYALNSATKEHGFKADEGWKFSLATEAEKAELEHKYYPTVSTQISSEHILKLSELVKVVLNRTPAFAKEPLNVIDGDQQHAEYIIAYNPIRVHR